MLAIFGIGKGDKENFPQFDEALEIYLKEVSKEEDIADYKVFRHKNDSKRKQNSRFFAAVQLRVRRLRFFFTNDFDKFNTNEYRITDIKVPSRIK